MSRTSDQTVVLKNAFVYITIPLFEVPMRSVAALAFPRGTFLLVVPDSARQAHCSYSNLSFLRVEITVLLTLPASLSIERGSRVSEDMLQTSSRVSEL